MKDHFAMFARYNAWANARLYDAAAALNDAQYRADRGAFFKSMHGTLNHLLAADRIWMRRFTGEGTAPDRLDAILYDDFKSLSSAREAEDQRAIAYIDRLDGTRLSAEIRYRRVSGPEEQAQPLAEALAHWFNHQTHHRGQAHAILTGLAGHAPELDLLLFQRLASATSIGEIMMT
jgi:uncharacterized damage-inducible protein DinB